MYIKNINNWLNESYKNEKKIIFHEFLFEYFGNNHEAMIEWLNKNWANKKVYYLGSDNYQIIDNNQNSEKYFIVSTYFVNNYSDKHKVRITTNDGRSGNPGGLIYLDEINLPGKVKYKKIKKPEIDPYEEEDWGYEEIK